MKLTWTIVILSGFLTVSLFGLLTVYDNGGYMLVNCLASQINGSQAPCPLNNPLGFANFHNDALKKISNLLLIDGSALFYVVVLVALGFFRIFSAENNKNSRTRLALAELKEKSSPLKAKKLFWLALHEKCPPVYAF